MKDRKNFINYSKGVLSFGKHRGKTIKQIINEGDYGYILWLNNNITRITISTSDYEYCKRMVAEEQAMYEAIIEEKYSNYGNRD